ncbi:alpha-ketoglutarate dependent xanthine dioxygenase [Lecanosticta acicola]|uniref:Alpha-ketoglutarate dependent xanthine dioxygenase n=1 Tax=Lecanosticta acicola TaxID=111012 RepID=A0AAI8Z461_9PEZI|nr:alpha-ketoglutarate dependent xanthine dioxygenase [Lecanosticta acicola]
MPHSIESLKVVPLDGNLRKDTGLGAEVQLSTSMPLLEPLLLTMEDQERLRRALFENGVLVVRNQQGIHPDVLPQLARIFDPNAKGIHSGGAKQVTEKKNILALNNGSRIPRSPQVIVIGKGNTNGHEGIVDLELKHLDHTSFHETPLSPEEIAAGYTRPYRWHMDAPVYENLPGFATVLHCVEAPELPDQKMSFPTGIGMDIAAGATAFFSGARNFELLSPEEREFALNTTVQYAPRAYEWMKDCKATDDGLTIARPGREKAENELTPFEWEKVHAYPMVWRNASTDAPHLQILGCCVESLHTRDPASGEISVIDNLAEVRRICHQMQSKIYKPEHVYAHRWRKGDLVIFHNRGVLHSITGQLESHPQRRLLWQCSMATETPPEAYRK